jgi:putative intracellular protease/amidase
VTIDGIWVGDTFIDHFNIRLVAAFKCSAISVLRTLQITTAYAKSFQSAVITSGSLVTASNSGDSTAFMPTLLLSGEYPTTELNSK